VKKESEKKIERASTKRTRKKILRSISDEKVMEKENIKKMPS